MLNKNESILLEAITSGTEQSIKHCLSSGANPLARDKKGMTILHHAVLQGRKSAVELLLNADKTLSLEEKGEDNMTLLHVAAMAGHGDLVEFLIQRGASIEAKCDYDFTPLLIAVVNGRLNAVEKLLEYKADIEPHGEETWVSALMMVMPLAIEHGSSRSYIDIVDRLLKAKSNTELRNKKNQTPLIAATMSGVTTLVRLLLESGAQINTTIDYGYTALFCAIEFKHIDCVKLLLEYGASTELTDDKDRTPLYLAIAQGEKEIVELLLKHNANPNPKSEELDHPLMVAVNGSNEIIVSLLLESKKMSPDMVTLSLYLAIEHGLINIAKLLLQNGADPNGKNIIDSNPLGRTPLHEALEKNQEKVVKLLLDHGANPLLCDKSGRSVEDIAKQKGNRNIIRLFEKKIKSDFFKGENKNHRKETDSLIAKQDKNEDSCCRIM